MSTEPPQTEPLRARFDLIAKELLCSSLQPFAQKAEKEYEIAVSGMVRVDYAFEPDPARSAERQKLGLLGRMTDEPCFIEAFHRPPGAMTLLGSIRKQLAHAQLVERLTGKPLEAPRRLWIVSAGRPAGALEQLRARPVKEWPPGVYALAPGMNVWILVANKLPATRDTLFVRLLGSGAALKKALRELRALPRAAWERELALDLFVQQRLTIEASDELSSEEDAELIMATYQLVEEFKKKQRDEGRLEGRLEGQLEGRLEGQLEGRLEGRLEGARGGIFRLFERRFGPMPKGLKASVEAQKRVEVLEEWIAIVGTEDLDVIESTLRPATGS
ncbi:MAG: hypothetical protein HYV07_32650 [Deltaproteobacteria bacterium]|nr:hypothetical protein [Deltaproteobacteria bacterium]